MGILSIKGYLERTELFRIGKLSARLHRIKDIDRTPFVHTHPFTYLSIILRGGYTEQILQNGVLVFRKNIAGSFIIRYGNVAHRICEVLPGTVTLFFAYYKESWELFEHDSLTTPAGYHDLPDGMYRDTQTLCWRRRENRRWYVTEFEYQNALKTERLSIFQNIPATEVRFRNALDPSK